jgi:hypothetical protein
MDHRHPIGSQSGPSVIRALKSVGKTTTQVWWSFYWHHHNHHFGDDCYDF